MLNKIVIEKIGKKFGREWIFRNRNLTFFTGEKYAITGSNGSGKSTLLQVISGFLPQTEGSVHYHANDGLLIAVEDIFKEIVWAAPYMEVVEEFTLLELVKFHNNFKKFQDNITAQTFAECIELPKAQNKQIKHFSSGMKQRLKLGLAFYSKASIILLDEPTTNLDKAACLWYNNQIDIHTANRLLIVCSNESREYDFCKNIVSMST